VRERFREGEREGEENERTEKSERVKEISFQFFLEERKKAISQVQDLFL